MDDRVKLHVRRIADGLSQIASFRDGSVSDSSPDFQAWKDRITHSLSEVFGPSHSYTLRFSRLRYFVFRRVGLSQVQKQRDPQVFNRDLALAEQILTDCLDEIGVAPPLSQEVGEKDAGNSASAITVNVMNVLSQNVEVHMTQLLAGLKNLGLSKEQHEEAEKLARELEKETKGEQRWPAISKTLESLRSLGKTVYKEIAIPLLLEMLKKQAGV
jgi:hypothetical protein